MQSGKARLVHFSIRHVVSKPVSQRPKFVSIEKSAQLAFHRMQVRVVSQSRFQLSRYSWLLRINLPRVEVHNHGPGRFFFELTECIVCIAQREYSKVSASRRWKRRTPNPHCRWWKLREGCAVIQSVYVREPLCPRHPI